MLLTIETDHSRGRATNADVVSARGASATVVPRREEIKEVVVFVEVEPEPLEFEESEFVNLLIAEAPV